MKADDRVGLRASGWVAVVVGVAVIAAAGISAGVEISRDQGRHRGQKHHPVASSSKKPEPTVPGRRPAPGPLKNQGRQVAELVSDPPGDLTLTSFSLLGSKGIENVAAFVLDARTGTFVSTPYSEAALSPDGRTVAGIVQAQGGKAAQAAVQDRRTGTERRVSLPPNSGFLRWAPRGRLILASLYSQGLGNGLRGFAVIDADSLRVQITPVTGKGRPKQVDPKARFSWDATGEHVVALGQGSRLHRFVPGRGEAGPVVALSKVSDAPEVRYSPSGRMLACSDLRKGTPETIVWDVTGRAPREIRRLPGRSLVGWYDDSRLLATRLLGHDGWETALVGLDGKAGQVVMRDGVPGPGPGVMGVYSPIPRA